jgi:hypothetical protein
VKRTGAKSSIQYLHGVLDDLLDRLAPGEHFVAGANVAHGRFNLAHRSNDDPGQDDGRFPSGGRLEAHSTSGRSTDEVRHQAGPGGQQVDVLPVQR